MHFNESNWRPSRSIRGGFSGQLQIGMKLTNEISEAFTGCIGMKAKYASRKGFYAVESTDSWELEVFGRSLEAGHLKFLQGLVALLLENQLSKAHSAGESGSLLIGNNLLAVISK